MKKILGLLLLIPLTTIAADHGGKPMPEKGAQQASEHGGKAMEKKEEADKTDEHAGTAAEQGGQPSKKKASEHGGAPVE